MSLTYNKWGLGRKGAVQHFEPPITSGEKRVHVSTETNNREKFANNWALPADKSKRRTGKKEYQSFTARTRSGSRTDKQMKKGSQIRFVAYRARLQDVGVGKCKGIK